MADLGLVPADSASILGSNQSHTYAPNQVVRYAFFDSLPNVSVYGPANAGYFGPRPGTNGQPYFASFNPSEREKIREMFDQIERITTWRFQRVGINEAPEMRFGISEMSAVNASGVAFPLANGQDIFLDDDQVIQLGLGEHGYATLIHEIGHALNLRHPREGTPPLSITGPDSHRVSIMSDDTAGSIDGRYGSSPLVLEIAALQQRYGIGQGVAQRDVALGAQNPNLGNTYTFVPGVASSAFNPYSVSAAEVRGIWDPAGIDRFDASAFTSASSALHIDLVPGHFSSIGRNNNIGIAFGTMIENATGGSGNDTLIGNDGVNVLKGVRSARSNSRTARKSRMRRY